MKIHTEGCLDIFSEQIASNIGGVGGVGIGIGLVQVKNHISKTGVDNPEMQKVIKIAEINFWQKKIAPKNGRKITQNDPK